MNVIGGQSRVPRALPEPLMPGYTRSGLWRYYEETARLLLDDSLLAHGKYDPRAETSSARIVYYFLGATRWRDLSVSLPGTRAVSWHKHHNARGSGALLQSCSRFDALLCRTHACGGCVAVLYSSREVSSYRQRNDHAQ